MPTLSPACINWELAEDCPLELHQVMDEPGARDWMNSLLAEVALEERSITLFGKTILQPRLVGWGGELPYTYSGQTLAPRRMGQHLTALQLLTQELSGHPFNHALVNLYRNGADSMGMHSDDEVELGQRPVIASWSFGSSRRLVFAEKKGKIRHQLSLSSGQLLVMAGATQHRFRHGLPKDPRVQTPRLNVTFRWVQDTRSAARR